MYYKEVGGVYSNVINKLISVQKRMLKIINNVKRIFATEALSSHYNEHKINFDM